MQNYDCKIIDLGDYFKVVRYERKVYMGANRNCSRSLNREEKLIDKYANNEKVNKTRKLKSKEIDEFHYLVYLNFREEGKKLITLTYREGVTVEQASRDFEQWIKRMRKRFGDFKYLAVRSFQERGTIHYHVLVNIPRIPVEMLKNREFENIWGHGGVNITKGYGINAVYLKCKLSKYLVGNIKEFKEDERGYGKQAYTCSKNLKKPNAITGDYGGLEKKFRLYNLESVNKQTYRNDYLGRIESIIYKKESF